MASGGRIEAVRQRVLSLRKTLALASVGVFAIALGFARSHESQTARSGTAQARFADGEGWDGEHASDGDEDDDGVASTGSLGAAQGAPQVQTGAS